MKTWEQGEYQVTCEWLPDADVWSIQHKRNGRLLESVHTSNDDTADNIMLQWIDESKSVICRRRFA